MASTEIITLKEEHCQIVTQIEQDRREYFEKLADTQFRGFKNVYHVCLNQADTVYDSFESFLIKIMTAEEDMSRVLSNDSKLFEDTLMTKNCCICRELRENFTSDQRQDEFGLIEDKMGNGPEASSP